MSLLISLVLAGQETIQVAGEDLRPGLVAEYRGSDGATLVRVDAKPSATWGTSSPHPRIPPGPFRVTWSGVFVQPESDTLRFGAYVGGRLRLSLGGLTVVEGRGEKESAWVGGDGRAWKAGTYRIKVEYESLTGVPARLQLFWEGDGFSREPLPPWRLKHDERPPALVAGETIERGRRRVAELGCARCHTASFPPAPEGPALERLKERATVDGVLDWLGRPGGRMPALFSNDRTGFVERWIVARRVASEAPRGAGGGNARDGKRSFLGLGCAACHAIPDPDPDDPEGPARPGFERLHGRWNGAALSAFLQDPGGRMPKLPVSPKAAADIAAYLLASPPAPPAGETPTDSELSGAVERLGAKDLGDAARILISTKGCARCHSGLGSPELPDVPLRARGGCLEGKSFIRYALDERAREAIAAYVAAAPKERHASPFEDRRRLLEGAGCKSCHARDTDQPPPIEEVGSTQGGIQMHRLPFQRTPRLTHLFQKYRRSYVRAAVRDGAAGARPNWYSYRMPAYGRDAEEILRALAEADGDLPEEAEPAAAGGDPTLHNVGPSLVGFEGYSCVSCHIWKGQEMTGVDPGAVGPELTTVTARIRREWFDRWLEEPARIIPGTPMPQIFPRGRPATVESILGGDPVKQKEALWAYLLKGKDAPSPKSLPPTPVPPPRGPPLVSQIPLRLPDKALVESITLLYGTHDVLVYDVGALKTRAFFTGAQLLRIPKDRRSFALTGDVAAIDLGPEPKPGRFLGYDRLPDGVRVRTEGSTEVIRVEGRTLVRECSDGRSFRHPLPAAHEPRSPVEAGQKAAEAGSIEGSLLRPGYRAIAYPRPKTSAGEDAVMPGAIVGHPRDGRVFVASMKTGDLFVVQGEGKDARFVSYAHGLFQDAYSMVCEEDLYVLHRRNLTRVRDTDGDGVADSFDRVIGLAHGVQENIDNAYGLVREPSGSWIFTYAANTNKTLPGWGSILRARGDVQEEVSHGLRRAFGWCRGPDNEVFFTDNQGEWVATSKFAHLTPGKFYGFPNPSRKEHASKPMAKATVWIPYGWARSPNGMAFDATGGKFGPFGGQFFLAEMMYGGAIVRVQVEKVKGQYQGAVFPFWGKGLMGPLVCAFDSRGRLWVGSVTEASCMSQPDRGAVFRIDFTGETPFEFKSIHLRPNGFRLVFTEPVDPRAAGDAASYVIDHHRYEYTGAYGSPELDRTRLRVERVDVSADGRSVDLTTGRLLADRVYVIQAPAVRSANGESLVHPAAAYTINEIP